MRVPTIVVHGGAGRNRFRAKQTEAYRDGLIDAARVGLAVLASGGDPLDAAEAAVRAMESSGAFNAGVGSCLTLERTVESDAAVMVGADRRAGACGAVPCVEHPVTLARQILERTDHILLVGEGARRFAEGAGLAGAPRAPSGTQLARYERARARREAEPRSGFSLRGLERMLAHGAESGEELPIAGGELPPPSADACDTVGAIALDARGRLAAAVSTGGLWLKLPGRVGDSAIVGAGLYADDRCGAAVATGVGEAILRAGLSRRTCDLMAAGSTAQQAVETACRELEAWLGPDTAGLIAIDRAGRPGWAMNTEAMGRALFRVGMADPLVRLRADEGPPPAVLHSSPDLPK